jgi:hypothetical protein
MTFILTAVVNSAGRENGFRDLFWVRKVLVSRTGYTIVICITRPETARLRA